MQQADLINCLNSPATFHEISTKQKVNVGEMKGMYDNEYSTAEERESEPLNASRKHSKKLLT